MSFKEVVISHMADPFNPTVGGSVKYSLNLLRYLSEKGIRTTFVGVQLGKKPSMLPKYRFIPILKGARARIWYIFFINLLIKVPFLKIPKTALIHTFRLEATFIFVLFYPRNPKVFVVGSPPLHYAKLNWSKVFPLVAKLYRLVESFCLRRIDCVITTEAIKRYYVKRYPWAADKIHVMPVSGVELDTFKPLNKNKLRRKYGFLQKDKIVIFLGRLEKVKNLDFLLRSFVLVKKRIPEVKLLIVGRGGDEPRLKKLINALSLRDVIFTGELHADKIPEVLNCADVLSLCTLADGCEGSPTVIREAIACGIPVVSTDVGDVRRVIKKNLLGRVVCFDEKSFAQAIIDVLHTDPEKIKQECRRASRAFSFDALAERVINVYRLVLSAHQLSDQEL